MNIKTYEEIKNDNNSVKSVEFETVDEGLINVIK
jgi:hypothetical protein